MKKLILTIIAVSAALGFMVPESAENVKHYFDENGFMYITGKDTREIYKSVYVKSSNESMALPVKNMEREEVFENGKYTCFYTYTIINPTFKRIIDFARNSLPEGYYDSLDSKIKGI